MLALYLPSLARGGIERGTVALANHWAREGRAVTLLLDRAEGPVLAEVDPAVPVLALGAGRTARALPPLLRFLRRTRPALLHSALPWNNLVALVAGRIAGVPVSIAQHGLQGGRQGVKSLALPLLARLAYGRAHAIVAPSAAVARDLVRTAGVAPGRVAVVGNPVVPACVPCHRAPPGPPSFLALGRLAPVKDYPTLLRAFRRVLDRGPARLVLVGEGAERARLTALAARLELGAAFEMPGAAADPWPLLAAAGTLVVSSRAEGFGNTVVEALACGTPVVATRCGGPEELLQHGRLGTLAPVGDAEALASAMLAPPPSTAAERRAGAAPFTVPAVAARMLAALGLG